MIKPRSSTSRAAARAASRRVAASSDCFLMLAFRSVAWASLFCTSRLIRSTSVEVAEPLRLISEFLRVLTSELRRSVSNVFASSDEFDSCEIRLSLCESRALIASLSCFASFLRNTFSASLALSASSACLAAWIAFLDLLLLNILLTVDAQEDGGGRGKRGRLR